MKKKSKIVRLNEPKKKPEEGILITISASHSTSGKTYYRVTDINDKSVIESGFIDNTTIPQCGYIVLCKILQEYKGIDVYMFDKVVLGFVFKGKYSSKSYNHPDMEKCNDFVSTLTDKSNLYLWDRKRLGDFSFFN
jgi:hypothetical protein